MQPPTPRRFKDGIFQQLARIGRAAAAPKRLELLELLCQAPRTVEALAREAEISVANASQHLRILRAARLVEAQKKGLYVEYQLADAEVRRFYLCLRGLAGSRLAEVEHSARDWFERHGTVEAVGGDELLRRARRGEVTVLDVRPAEEYRAGHLPGARSIPLRELRARLRELPEGREVVAYCRGPYCVMSAQAVALLRRSGLPARRLALGVPEWRAGGRRIEIGDGNSPAR